MKLLTLREAANKLNLKEETLRMYCRRKEIPTVRLRSRAGYKFIESEVNRWIREKRIPARRRN